MKVTSFYFALFVLLTACGNNRSYEGAPNVEASSASVGYDDLDGTMEADFSPSAPEMQTPSTANEPIQPSKIIKTGNMAFEVTELESAKSSVDSLLRLTGAYFEREQYRTEYSNIAYDLIIRVPSTNFERLVNELEAGAGRLTEKSISANDVSEEYYDLTIRLANKLAYLEQYQAILKKAKTIEEILEVQEKIRAIEEEIESKKGRLKFLDDRVGLSTLHLVLTQPSERYVADDPTIFTRIKKALAGGGEGVVEVFIGLVYLWPLLLGLLVLFLARKRIGRLFGRGERRV